MNIVGKNYISEAKILNNFGAFKFQYFDIP